MAIPRKGSRIITVDGTTYRWYLRRRPTHSQYEQIGDNSLTFSVEHAEAKGCVLVAGLPQMHPAVRPNTPAISVVPSQVAEAIKQALSQGWKPVEPGSPFYLNRQPGE